MSRQRRQETELERRLREERPEAPERLVRMVAERSGRSGRPRLAPRLALVGAVTAVMLAALGATGTAGHAAVAISSIGSTIGDVVHVYPRKVSKPVSKPHVSKPSGTSQAGSPRQDLGNDATGDKANGGIQGTDVRSANDGGNEQGGDPGHAYPWQDQYGDKWAICHNGQTLYLPLPGFNAHLLHGDQPGECS